MHVRMLVRTYLHTYIHSYTCKFARPPLTEMEIIRVIALFIWQRVMAATVAASRNEAVFNTLLRQHRHNSFIQSNEVECADCV